MTGIRLSFAASSIRLSSASIVEEKKENDFSEKSKLKEEQSRLEPLFLAHTAVSGFVLDVVSRNSVDSTDQRATYSSLLKNPMVPNGVNFTE